MSIDKRLVESFGDKIKPDLKAGFTDYKSGSELEFIDDFLDVLDNVGAKGGGQHLHVKAKKSHGYPRVSFDTGISSHPKVSDEIVGQLENKNPEMADLLVILNVYEKGSVAYRQAFFSQTKCVKNVKVGYQYWDIDSTQYFFMRAKPQFKLDYTASTKSFDVAQTPSSAFNYSFVGDVHRPFFYRPNNMRKYMRTMSGYHRFQYGTNPVSGFRFTISVLKLLLYGRYGKRFNDGSEFYDLIHEIYTHATLNVSKSSSTLPDGGTIPSNSNSPGGMGIVQVSVDSDYWFDGEFPPPSPEGGLRVENISSE